MKKKQRRFDNRINAGSMADIAFLLLIFFLVTTTILSDKGILVKLPPWDPDMPPAQTVDRNVFSVKINAQNQLLVEGEFQEVEGLRSAAKEFIMNPTNRQDLAKSPTKAVISLQNDRGTAYDIYLGVYNELKAAYNELWEEKAIQLYQKSFETLSMAQKRNIRSEIPMVISEAEPTEHIIVEN